MISYRKCWLRWIVITASGWIAGLVGMLLLNASLIRLIKALVVLAIFDPSESALDEVMQDNIGDGIPVNFINFHLAAFYGAVSGMLYGAVFGAIGGTAQWLFLRKKIANAYGWILSNTIGWSAVCGVIWLTAWTEGWVNAFGLTLSLYWGLLGALGIGLLGWLVLRQSRQKAYRWILVALCDWLVLRTVMMTLYQQVIGEWTFTFSYLWLASGAASGIVTGGGMIWILRQPKIEDG